MEKFQMSEKELADAISDWVGKKLDLKGAYRFRIRFVGKISSPVAEVEVIKEEK